MLVKTLIILELCVIALILPYAVCDPEARGCFNVNAPSRSLNIAGGPVFSVHDCIDICKEKNQPFAGVEGGSSCYCGRKYDTHKKSGKCNLQCASGETCGGWTAISVYKVPPEKWTKVYCVKSGSGITADLSYWGEGDYKGWGSKSCSLELCPDYYRSPFLDGWDDLPINEVKVALIKDNKEVKHLTFDGSGTSSTSWFTMSRVLESPWVDVHNGAKNNYFAIRSVFQRSFYISQVQYNCDLDTSWLAVIGAANSCNWQKHATYPQILYSAKNTSIKFANEYALADSLAVYISF